MKTLTLDIAFHRVVPKLLSRLVMEQTQTRNPPATVKIFGRAGSALDYMLRDFLHRSDVPFEWIELTADEDARAKAGVESPNDSRLPVCVFPDGARLECPTIRQITEKFGGSTIPAAPNTIWRFMGPGLPV
jgi:thioredoxin reductase (NADPH)